MILNYIWVSFFIVAFLVAIFQSFNGNPEIFSLIVYSILNFESSCEIPCYLSSELVKKSLEELSSNAKLDLDVLLFRKRFG